MESYEVIRSNGHYEVFVNGKFFCSADSYVEAVKEIENEKE